MELTINEIIDAFDYIKHVGNGEFEYKHCREGIALDEAVIIMRKYQEIEELIEYHLLRVLPKERMSGFQKGVCKL